MDFGTGRQDEDCRGGAAPKSKVTELSKKTKELCLRLCRPLEQLAAKVGVTFSTVKRWENGKGKPSPLAMRQIEELMDRTGESQ